MAPFRLVLTLAISFALGCAAPATVPPTASSGMALAGESAATARTGAGRNYDPSSIETLSGAVVRVDRIPGRRSEGLHVIVDNGGGETIPVHLGPAAFVEARGFRIEEGDAVEATGSLIQFGGAPALIAREVTIEGKTLVLRDEAGVPLWGGAGLGRGRMGAGPGRGQFR